MAGLTAARALTRQGWDTVVLDKGRGLGGRLATRRFGPDTGRSTAGRADHGAQALRAESSAFASWLAESAQTGLLQPWPGRTGEWIAPAGLSAVAKYLAADLTVHTGQLVNAVAATATGWTVTTESGAAFSANALLCTIPAPQALALVQQGEYVATAADQAVLAGIAYDPCLTALVQLSAPSNVPAPGGHWLRDRAVEWVADNQQKGISPDWPTLTVQAGAAFSQTWLEGDLTEAGRVLLAELADWIPADRIETVQMHRWRYSQTRQGHPAPFWAADAPHPLLFGGDGFGGIGPFDARLGVERAYASGCAMAAALTSR